MHSFSLIRCGGEINIKHMWQLKSAHMLYSKSVTWIFYYAELVIGGGVRLIKVSVCFKRSSRSSPPTPFWYHIEGHPTISVTFWNRQSRKRALFTRQIARCAEVRRYAAFELPFRALFFHFSHNCCCHFSWVQPSAMPRMRSQNDTLKVCIVIPNLNVSLHLTPLYDSRPLTQHLSVCFSSDLFGWHMIWASSFWAPSVNRPHLWYCYLQQEECFFGSIQLLHFVFAVDFHPR